MKYLVTIDDLSFNIDVSDVRGELTLKIDGREIGTSVVTDQDHRRFLMLLDSRSFDSEVAHSNGVTSVLLAGREFECVVEDERLVSIRKVAGIAATSHETHVKAPMPGLIVKLLKNVGDHVKKGESLLLIEAMKMENELKAPADGVVREINAQAGRPVDKGQVLITLSGHD